MGVLREGMRPFPEAALCFISVGTEMKRKKKQTRFRYVRTALSLIFNTKNSKEHYFYSLEFNLFNFAVNYSVLSATTGSFFAALLEGIIPEKSVRSTLITTRTIAACQGRTARRFSIPVRARRIIFIGMQSR